MLLFHRLRTLKLWIKSPETSSLSQSSEVASWAASWPVPLAGDVRLLKIMLNKMNVSDLNCCGITHYLSVFFSKRVWPGGDTDVP